MKRNQPKKKKRVTFKCPPRATQEDLSNLLKKLQERMDKVENGPSSPRFRARPARCQATVASAFTSSPSDPRGVLNVRTKYEQNEVPVCNTYEEYEKTVIRETSFENISIVLNIDGKVIFISQNVSPLLGHRPEDIVGKTLLNILLDEEKEEISQKIVLNLPLAKSVGNLIEFCCYVRKGNAGRDALDTYDYRNMYEGRDTYEYVKFILYLQDSYDESFVFFGNYGPNSRNIWSSTPRLLWENRYYLVGTISVLRTKAESEHPVEIQPTVIFIESDDDTKILNRRLLKRQKRNGIQRNCKTKNLNMERHESGNEVEIVDIQPATQQTPFELVPIRPPSQSSTCSIISVDTNMSMTTSISSTEFLAASFSPASSFEQDSTIDPKFLLEPVDMEFEVAPEFLLDDSQEEQASPEQGECSDEDVKKPLEEATGSNPKEHVIDEVPGTSSDEDYCVIVKEINVKKGPKVQEPIADQEQGHQKTVKTAPKCPSTVEEPLCPKAVVKPMVHTDLPAYVVAEPRRPCHFQGSLLGESCDQSCYSRLRTQFCDLCISRSFHEEPPSYREIEEEERQREQCEYELALRIEMIHNSPYKQPMAQQQMGQRQETQVYRPQDQVVTVTNNLGRLPINSFGDDNSAYPRNETQSFSGMKALTMNIKEVDIRWMAHALNRVCDDNVNHTPPLFCQPLPKSRQTTSVPRQPVAETYHPLGVNNFPSAPVSQRPYTRSQSRLSRSHLASSNTQRENGPHLIIPGQENPGYVRAEENIDPHP